MVAFNCVSAIGQSSPEIIQARGIAALDHVREQFRRSGMQPSMLTDYTAATRDLKLSYLGFVGTSNFTQAALSLTKLADCERQQALFARLGLASGTQNGGQLAETLARSSRDHYSESAALARKTGTSSQLVKALTGLALLERTQYQDFGAANSAVTEAIRAASSCTDVQDCRREALLAKVELETARGELFSAASHVNGLLTILKHDSSTDSLYMEYSAYADRAAIYYAMADGCSDTYQISTNICYRLFDLGKADWLKARDVAKQAGYNYFVMASQEEIQNIDTLRRLTEFFNNHDNIPAGTFDPKNPKDVLAGEIFHP